MRLVERTYIPHPPETVWSILIVSEFFARWNDKIASMSFTGPFSEGAQFWTTYRWRGVESTCRTTVQRMVPGETYTLVHSDFQSAKIPPGATTHETVMVRMKGSGTEVSRTVETFGAGEPWFLKPIIWFVTRFGKRSEPDPLPALIEESLAVGTESKLKNSFSIQQSRSEYP